MNYSATGPEGSFPAHTQRQSTLSLVFFLAMAFALLMRFTVSPQLLNMVVNYTADQGAFYEKLHVGTYAIFLLLPIVLFSRPITLRGDEIGTFKALLRYSVLILSLIHI